MIDLRKIGCDVGSWVELAQDRVQWRTLITAALDV
jgi:hypothetical protein